MQRQSATAINQKRDQDQEDGRRHRNKMTKLQDDEEKPPPPPPALRLQEAPLSPVSSDEEDDDYCDDLVSSDSDHDNEDDDEIVISTTDNKFDLKPRGRAPVATLESPVDESSETECDADDGDIASRLALSETGEPQQDSQRNQLSRFVAATATTTLSPSPTPFPSPLSPPPTAIDYTTSKRPASPCNDSRSGRRIPPDSGNQPRPHHHSRVIPKLTQQQRDHLDALIASIKRDDYDEFCKLMMENKRELKQNLLNVFVNGHTVFHYSLIFGRSLEWCKQLISSGANPNLVGKNGFHPIHMAAYACSTDTLRYVTDLVSAV